MHAGAETAAEPSPPAQDAPSPHNTAGSGASLTSLQQGWVAMLDGQSTPARARFLAGSVTSIDNGVVRFELPSDAQMQRCEKYRGEVESAIQATFDPGLTLQLAVGDGGTPPQPGLRPTGSVAPTRSVEELPANEDVDVTDLTDADVDQSAVTRITDVFPGAEVLPDTPTP